MGLCHQAKWLIVLSSFLDRRYSVRLGSKRALVEQRIPDQSMLGTADCSWPREQGRSTIVPTFDFHVVAGEFERLAEHLTNNEVDRDWN
jgi:hypothetical protein